jgi:hypothetical protein
MLRFVKSGAPPLRFSAALAQRAERKGASTMKKSLQRKISLSRETVHRLDGATIRKAAGASNGECSNPATCQYNSCPYTCSDRLC